MYTGLVLNGILSIHHNQQSKHFLCSETVTTRSASYLDIMDTTVTTRSASYLDIMDTTVTTRSASYLDIMDTTVTTRSEYPLCQGMKQT
jgi:hypothetical protein